MQAPTATANFAPVDSNNPALTFGNYLVPLPESTQAVLPLTAEEAGCNIFALSADWRRDEDEAKGRDKSTASERRAAARAEAEESVVDEAPAPESATDADGDDVDAEEKD